MRLRAKYADCETVERGLSEQNRPVSKRYGVNGSEEYTFSVCAHLQLRSRPIMHVTDWIKPPVESLLDVGCNVGAWLDDCARLFPEALLAGVDINQSAVESARRRVPRAQIKTSGAEALPFADESFQYVTCVEVLEHLPPDLRPAAFREIFRVLKPGGNFVLTVPHAGAFAWLDSNNLRFRLPRLYGQLVGGGRRDASYAALSRTVEWHHHFTLEELMDLMGPGWKIVAVRRGGLFLYPVMDWLSWPFYRVGASRHRIRQLFERVAGLDYGIDFGRASYGILLVLERGAKDYEANQELSSR